VLTNRGPIYDVTCIERQPRGRYSTKRTPQGELAIGQAHAHTSRCPHGHEVRMPRTHWSSGWV
jgi:hypothetical protein